MYKKSLNSHFVILFFKKNKFPPIINVQYNWFNYYVWVY